MHLHRPRSLGMYTSGKHEWQLASGYGDLLRYAASLFKFVEGFCETTACNVWKNAMLPSNH